MNSLLNRRRVMLATLNNSPYSKTATAILQEDFPNDWETIKAYGYSNPNMVQYVNEDPYIVVSLGLVSGVYRLLYNDYKKSYIDTGILYNANSNLSFEYYTSKGCCGVHSGNVSSISSPAMFVQPIVGSSNYAMMTSTSQWIAQSTIDTDYAIGKLSNNVLSISDANNVIKCQSNISSVPNNNILIFGAKGNNGTYVGNAVNCIKFVLNNNSTNLFLVPFRTLQYRTYSQCYPQIDVEADTIGMIDLINGIFYPSANSEGAFTIKYKGLPFLNITNNTRNYIIYTYGNSAWEAVKTYFSDPTKEDLVKYVNEDPDIVCSLVNIGYTRWLVGDGNSVIKTSYIFSDPNAIIYTKFQKTSNKTQWLFGCRNDQSLYPIQVAITADNKSRIGFGPNSYGATVDFNTGININNVCNVVLKKNYCTINGIQQSIESYVNMPNVDGSNAALYVLGLKRPDSTGDYFENLCFGGKIAYLKIEANNPINLVPFVRNNVIGMIDLITNTFYANGGTGVFTITTIAN